MHGPVYIKILSILRSIYWGVYKSQYLGVTVRTVTLIHRLTPLLSYLHWTLRDSPPNFLCLRNVLSDSLLHSFYLHYDLQNLLTVPFIYGTRCHTHPHFLHVHYALSDSTPISFIYIMRCINRPHFIFMLWAAAKKQMVSDFEKIIIIFFILN